VSYHLSDYAEARRTLAAARALRRRLIDTIPSERSGWDDLRYARATEGLDQTAQKYLARIDLATLTDAPAPPADLVADLAVHQRQRW
jgi:hypothetical protein